MLRFAEVSVDVVIALSTRQGQCCALSLSHSPYLCCIHFFLCTCKMRHVRVPVQKSADGSRSEGLSVNTALVVSLRQPLYLLITPKFGVASSPLGWSYTLQRIIISLSLPRALQFDRRTDTPQAFQPFTGSFRSSKLHTYTRTHTQHRHS